MPKEISEEIKNKADHLVSATPPFQLNVKVIEALSKGNLSEELMERLQIALSEKILAEYASRLHGNPDIAAHAQYEIKHLSDEIVIEKENFQKQNPKYNEILTEIKRLKAIENPTSDEIAMKNRLTQEGIPYTLLLQKNIGPIEDKIENQKRIILNATPFNISLLAGNLPESKETVKQLEIFFEKSVASRQEISLGLSKMIFEENEYGAQINRVKGLGQTAKKLARQGDINSAFVIAYALAQQDVAKIYKTPKDYGKAIKATKSIMQITLW
ncbi:MAG: hypothetical protein H0V82_13410 [Candidatus Protochlamydia sp.]|nr:hypothetical protein [Candidatus Protochlamydia sp.]